MTSLEEHCAALAAALIDDELAWRLGRLPSANRQTPMDRALLREAQRRGLRKVRLAQ
jgi:hypothetical protein